MRSMDIIDACAENKMSKTPGIRPVNENAYGSESAPAPNVALQRFDTDPKEDRVMHFGEEGVHL